MARTAKAKTETAAPAKAAKVKKTAEVVEMPAAKKRGRPAKTETAKVVKLPVKGKKAPMKDDTVAKARAAKKAKPEETVTLTLTKAQAAALKEVLALLS